MPGNDKIKLYAILSWLRCIW